MKRSVITGWKEPVICRNKRKGEDTMERKARKKYDAVVIGAGNGGLAAAIRILQGGYSCLLLEKHNLPGGFATSFKRGRFEFEASLHELNDYGSKEDPGDIRTLFRSLGVEDMIDWVRIPEAYHLIAKKKKYLSRQLKTRQVLFGHFCSMQNRSCKPHNSSPLSIKFYSFHQY